MNEPFPMVPESRAKPSVVLAHAGVQYSYPVAFALQEAGLLGSFWTTFYDFRNHQSRRFYPGLQKELIHSYPWPEAVHRAATLLTGGHFGTRDHVQYFRNRWFDVHVSLALGKTPFDYFMGYAGSCLNSIRKAKSLGATTIVDQHDIHPSIAEKILTEEIELHPDFAPLISYWPPHRGYLKCVRKELELADRIFVPSRFSLETHLEGGIPAEKLVHIPLGINLPKFQPSMNKETKPFRILFVGTISQRKGIKYLLEAVKQLHLPDLELVLIGQIDGDPKPLAPYRDFFKHVGFLSHDALRDYWQSSHALVLPSIYDGLGLVMLEAMACGLPVIVSDHTAGREVVRDGVDGFVFPSRNIEALKANILELYQNRERLHSMGQNAFQRAKEFTWEQYQERLSMFFNSFGQEPILTEQFSHVR